MTDASGSGGSSAPAWTNAAAIARWTGMSRADMEAHDPDGDFAKRHLVNDVLLRLALGAPAGGPAPSPARRILDAGCGQGYFARMLADRGARVVGVEPAEALRAYAVAHETERPRGIAYVAADLAALPDDPPLDEPFDAVVASMVLPAVPDWRGALRGCLAKVRPGGTFVFTVNHPCFEKLWPTWRESGGAYRLSEYFAEYEIEGRNGVDFHRTVSTYLNELIAQGARITEVVEPALDPAAAATGPEGIEAYSHLPNFLVVAATVEERLPT